MIRLKFVVFVWSWGAFIVLDDEKRNDDAKVLRQKLTKVLPLYMVPTRYEFLEKMPRLSSGKIDRKTLKESPFFRQEIGLDESDRATTEAETIFV
jgi:acyl-coenzyme A synthetase/AMP-(fatty) acid ligase